MKTETKTKMISALTAKGLGGAVRNGARALLRQSGRAARTGRTMMARAAMTLLLAVMTAATAWATSPVSNLDACTGGAGRIHFQGWAYDPDAPSKSLDVHVYVYTDEGCTNQYGGIYVIKAEWQRHDVNEAHNITGGHGFNADITIADAGNYWVKAFAIDTNGDNNKQIGSTTAVTVTEPYNVTLQDDNGTKYVNMPNSGTNRLTLNDATVTSFKMYDDGGAGGGSNGSAGNYSNNCDGYLILTAPEGCRLQLAGSIRTEANNDYLTVYDGTDTSNTATKLIDAVSSSSDGTERTITTISSGRSMMLYFHSDPIWNFAGLDLRVTLISTSIDYGITVNNASGGSVTASVNNENVTTAKWNDVVTLTATPSEGYVLLGFSVKDVSGNDVAVTGDTWYNNTATFTMPFSAVTVTPTFTSTLTAGGGLSVNMPTTGTKSVNIPAGVQSFKVYDDGGAYGSNTDGSAGNYSNNCDGYLILTAPEGCILQLAGSITAEVDDNLTVYDGDNNQASTLLENVSEGYKTVISSGRCMTLYFHSDGIRNWVGLDLTVTIINPNADFALAVNSVTGGSVTASVGGESASTAKWNDVVTLTATPSEGYVLLGFSVKDGSGNDVAVTDILWYAGTNTATFTMPSSAVTVTPTFTSTLTADGGLYINMPATGTKSINIPTGVQSFKVYDDGGADGDYSDYCDGKLTLTAPEGYVLQLAGSIKTDGQDNLLVYDGGDTSASMLIAVSSINAYKERTITTVVSTGQSMTLYFHSNDWGHTDGLDLTVTLISTSTEYGITVNNALGGSVATTVGGQAASTAKVHDVVSLTATPLDDYLLTAISVKDAGENDVAVNWEPNSNTATFRMPASTVAITPTFTRVYDIIVSNPAQGGTVASDKSKAMPGNTITLTVTPSEGYVLLGLSVKDGSAGDVAVTDLSWYAGTNTATFTMPASAVTVTPTFTSVNSLSVNMPKTGTKTATIPECVQSFKVYDDGGASGNYSDGCDGTLILTSPEGYVLQLAGSITTDYWDKDKLTVFDGADNNASTLLNEVSGAGTKTITTVTSTGQSMTLYFHSDGNTNFSGLDLTVTLINANTESGITVNNPGTGGSVAASVGGQAALTAKVNDEVTLTATPDEGYLLSDLSVTDGNGDAVTVDWSIWSNTATFTMPASAVTVTPTFTNDLTSLSVNMPTTGTKTVTIPECVQSFKVYDDGGASGSYSDRCNGYLTLNAPEGYVLQLSGSITTQSSYGYDKLTVYNGSDNSATKLLDAVSSTSNDTETVITTVTSSGQSMTLYFESDGGWNYAGLDLTVTLVSTSTVSGITMTAATGGSVAATVGGKSATTAKVNDEVTLTATPSEGYVLSSLSVVDGSGNAVAVDWNVWTNTATFRMPGSAVTVTPTFTNDLTSLSVNMPKTGTKTATIPTGVQSFKVYDDGGASGNYSDDCIGTLTLTAPTGYVLRLSGSITTEKTYDKLTVYDGTDNSASTLLNAVSSTSSGTQTAITTVTSSGQSMTLYFFSDYRGNYAGLDLTVTLVKLMELADNADNTDEINGWKNGIANVTLSGRTLYKDGAWNMLVLPFSVTAEQIAAHADFAGAEIRELSGAGFDGQTLTLNFTPATGEGAVTGITAGTPCIVKWTSGSDFTPTFSGVIIDATANDKACDLGDGKSITFRGTYAPLTYSDENRSVLFLGGSNTLYYPDGTGTTTIGACRAYFALSGLTAGDKASQARAFVLNFGDNETAIVSLSADAKDSKDSAAWYTLDGRRLSGKPTMRGVYVNNGKKIVIK